MSIELDMPRAERVAIKLRLQTGLIALVMAGTLALPALAEGTGCGCACGCGGSGIPRVSEGPKVVAASFSGGQLHETLTFHKTGVFVAHILSDPPSHPTGSGPVHGRIVALGNHAAGQARISFAVGTLQPGLYALVITPRHQTSTTNSKTAATWVYFTISTNGKATGVKLITP